MATLLPTDTAAILCHVFIDILVADSSFCISDALLIKSLVQTKVGHDSRDNSIGQQLATLLHVATIDVQNVVASNDIALFIYTQATVSIAVISKTDIQSLFHNKFLQALNVGRASVQVDVQTIGLVVDNICICTEGIKDRLCNVPAGAIGAVQADLDTLEGVNTQGN